MGRVLVLGYYGGDNVGDELLAHTICGWLKELGQDPVLISVNPQISTTIHGVPAISRYDLKALACEMKQSSLLVLGGGGLFQEHHRLALEDIYDYPSGSISEYAQICLMARQFGLPAVLLAQGVGPLYSDEAKEIVAQVFSNAFAVSVRDDASAEAIAPFGAKVPLTIAPDPVWALPFSLQSSPCSKTLCVVVREWDDQDVWQKNIAQKLAATSRNGWLIRFVNFGGAKDIPIIKAIKEAANLRDLLEVDAFRNPLHAAQAFADSRAVVAMRLHALIIAAKCGLPVAAIEYDPKVSAASNYLGLDPRLRLSLKATMSEYDAAFSLLLSLPEGASGLVAGLSKDALIHRDSLKIALDNVASLGPKPRWSFLDFDWFSMWASHEVRSLRVGVAELKSEVRRLSIGQCNRKLEYTRFQTDKIASLVTAAEQASRRHAEELEEQQRRHAEELKDQTCRHAASLHEMEKARGEIIAREQQLSVRLRDAELQRNRWEHRAKTIERSTWWRAGAPIRHLSAILSLATDGRSAQRMSALRTRISERGFRNAAKTAIRRLSEATRAAIWPEPRVRAKSNQDPEILNFIQQSPIAVVPCAFEFDELVNQRPINLCKNLSAAGYRVIYVPWQWSERDTLKRPNGHVYPGVVQVALHDYLELQTSLPTSTGEHGIYFITFPAQALLDAARSARMKGYTIVYDIMDDWAEFKNVGQAPWYLDTLETQAVLELDIVTVVSYPLKAKFENMRSDIQVIGNGFSPSVIADARNVGGQAVDPNFKIVAGYFGHLTDAWFDWEALLKLAASRPDILFELIGYGAPERQLETARSLRNIALVPATPPSELKNYTCRWNVGLIPFKPGALARSVDPIKVYEYLYMGIPAVVTGIPHLAQYPGTTFVERPADLAAAIVQQAASQKRLQEDPLVDEFLADATWTARFRSLILQCQDAARVGALYA